MPGVPEVAVVNLIIIAVIVLSIGAGVAFGLRALGHVLEEMSEGDE